MKFQGVFINEKGQKVNWWFEASSAEALKVHLGKIGWTVASLNHVERKNVSLAMLLSVFWLAGGHLYNGRLLKALGFFALGVTSHLLGYVIGSYAVIVGIGLLVWSMIKAKCDAEQINQREIATATVLLQPGDRKNKNEYNYSGGVAVGVKSIICPSCGERNNPTFVSCWKCHSPLVQVGRVERLLDYRPKDIELISLYTETLQPFFGSHEEVRSAAKTFVDNAISKSKNAGLYDKGPLGEAILAGMKTDERLKEEYEWKEAEGVKDEDILWWWNLDDVERYVLLEYDNWFRISAFLKSRENMSEEEAAKQVKKFYPICGDINDTSGGTGDDRLLPYELKNRINRWSASNSIESASKLRSELENSSSMNAFIRKKIREGEI